MTVPMVRKIEPSTIHELVLYLFSVYLPAHLIIRFSFESSYSGPNAILV